MPASPCEFSCQWVNVPSLRWYCLVLDSSVPAGAAPSFAKSGGKRADGAARAGTASGTTELSKCPQARTMQGGSDAWEENKAQAY